MWLRVKVIGAAAICIAIPVFAGVAAVTIATHASLRSSVESDLQAATNSASALLEERLGQDFAHLKAFAASPTMQDVLIGDNGGDIARILTGMRSAYGDFGSLTVTDARGAVVASTTKAPRPADVSADEGIRIATSGRSYQSAYGFHTASEPETIWFTVPLIAHYDRQTVIGTLTGVLDFDRIAKSVVARSALNATAQRMLVIEAKTDGRTVFTSRIDASLLNALQQIRGSRSGLTEFAWKDESYFAVSAPSKGKGLLRDPGFILRGIAPGASVFAAADTVVTVFGFIAGLAAAAALGLAWRWSTPLVNLGEVMERLARGNVFVAIPQTSPQHAFAPMARAIEVFRQTKVMRDRLASRERELLRAKEEAEAAALAKAEHLTSLSRELRAQLNTIIELSDGINRENLEKARGGAGAGNARDISRAATQLLDVINDLFALSEAEAGLSVLDESDVDLADIVRDSVALMREAAERAQIELACEGCDTPVMTRVDAQKIRQILFNLISNAVKFTAEQGHVQVRVKVTADGCPAIVVEDDGIGMPTNLSPVALTPFSASGEATPHGRHGAGLGLPLVRELVEMHLGTIDIESEVGKGTIVTVSLPADRLLSSVEEDEERLIA